MKLIKPIEFSTAHLISSSATETHAAWSSAITYAKDTFVDRDTFIYQSLVNSNLNNTPETSPTFWTLIGPDNTHAMFDTQVNTQTISASPLTVVIAPAKSINSVALINLEGATARVTMTDGAAGPVVYDSGVVSLIETVITDWYQYFFEEDRQRTDLVLTGIPPYISGVITLNLTGATVKIGNFIYGNLYELGLTQYGASFGIRDYSFKETDIYGNVTFVERAFSKRMETSMYVPNSQIPMVQKILQDVRAKPSVWIGSSESNYTPLVMYGYYRDFNVEIAYPSYSVCRLEIEGMI